MKKDGYENLRRYYYRHGEPSGYELNKKEHKDFKKKVREAASFIDDLPGEKKFSLYLWCVLNDVSSPPECNADGCSNKVNGVRKDKFNDYCSHGCFQRSSKEKILHSYEENGHPMHRKESYDKFKKSIKTSEAHKSYHQRRREENRKSRINYGVVFKQPLEDSYGNLFFDQVEWYGGFHPDALSDGAKSSISWLRHGLRSKGKAPDQIQKKWEEHLRIWEYRKRERGYHHNQKHIDDDANNTLQDRMKLKELYDRYGSIPPLADFLGVAVTTVNRSLHSLQIPIKQGHRVSYAEREIRTLVEERGVDDVLFNDRSILGFDVDIIIPSRKIAIEYNGIYYHSYPNKPRMHHQDKAIRASEQGYKMLHVWEDDWNDPVKKEIIKARIRFNLGEFNRIHARKCSIRQDMDISDVRKFFDDNHIQGFVSSSDHIALIYEGEIVACLMMKKVNRASDIYELTRYATNRNCQVMGGFTKCLNKFKLSTNWDEIYTYASLDYSNGTSYDFAGFVNEGYTVPGMWYTKNGKRYSRRKFMKSKLTSKLENFDPQLTEKQNMLNHGYLQLYDSGSIKYRLVNEKPLE